MVRYPKVRSAKTHLTWLLQLTLVFSAFGFYGGDLSQPYSLRRTEKTEVLASARKTPSFADYYSKGFHTDHNPSFNNPAFVEVTLHHNRLTKITLNLARNKLQKYHLEQLFLFIPHLGESLPSSPAIISFG